MSGPALSFVESCRSRKVRNERSAADVGERLILGDVKPAVREAALGVLDVVAADGDVEVAILIHVADARLAVVSLLILDAHLSDTSRKVSTHPR